MSKKPEKPKEVEVEPDAWDRFERAMGKITPPKKPKADDAGRSD